MFVCKMFVYWLAIVFQFFFSFRAAVVVDYHLFLLYICFCWCTLQSNMRLYGAKITTCNDGKYIQKWFLNWKKKKRREARATAVFLFSSLAIDSWLVCIPCHTTTHRPKAYDGVYAQPFASYTRLFCSVERWDNFSFTLCVGT